MAHIGQVMAGVGVGEVTALGVEDAIEAGDEHVGWNAGRQCLVDPPKYLAGRGGVQGLSGELQHAAGGGHHKRCGDALARCVPHCKAQSALREEVEVVEVSSHLPSWPIVGSDLSAF